MFPSLETVGGRHMFQFVIPDPAQWDNRPMGNGRAWVDSPFPITDPAQWRDGEWSGSGPLLLPRIEELRHLGGPDPGDAHETLLLPLELDPELVVAQDVGDLALDLVEGSHLLREGALEEEEEEAEVRAHHL